MSKYNKQSPSTTLIEWLTQGGPTHPKHHNLYHPVVVCIIHYVIVTTISIQTHDVLVNKLRYDDVCIRTTNNNNNNNNAITSIVTEQQQSLNTFLEDDQRQRMCIIGYFFALYFIISVIIWRVFIRKQDNNTTTTNKRPRIIKNCIIIYEICWLCNVTLWQGCFALLTNRPMLAIAYCVAVGIDQLLWYVDLIGYFFFNTFPIGVAKYLTWPGNTDWTCRITCTHHLWTIPLLLYAVGGRMYGTIVYPLSFIAICTNVLISRLLTPESIDVDKDNSMYLNVNLSHSLWKDIKFSFLQINYDKPHAPLYLFRLLWRWQGFNTCIFGLLYTICHFCFQEPIC